MRCKFLAFCASYPLRRVPVVNRYEVRGRRSWWGGGILKCLPSFQGNIKGRETPKYKRWGYFFLGGRVEFFNPRLSWSPLFLSFSIFKLRAHKKHNFVDGRVLTRIRTRWLFFTLWMWLYIDVKFKWRSRKSICKRHFNVGRTLQQTHLLICVCYQRKYAVKFVC